MDANPPISEPNPPDASGGAGGTRPKLAELRLFRHALRQGWTVPSDLKDEAVRSVGSIIKTAKSTRAKLAATRVLVSMTQATVSSIDCAVRVRASEDFDERLKALEAWQSQGGTEAERRPRINIPDRDPRRARNKVQVIREDRADEKPDDSPRSPGGSPPAPASSCDPSGSAADDSEDDRR